MNQDFEIYSVDDRHVYIVLQGKANGLIHFNDYEMFAAFFEKFFSFIQEYNEHPPIETALPPQPLKTSA